MKPAFMQVKRFPGTSRGSIRGTRECGGLANLFEKAAYLWRAGSTKDYANMPTGLRGARGGTYGFMTWITVKRQVSKSSIHPLVLLLLGHHERSQIKKLCEKKKVAPWKLAHQLSAKSVSWSLKLGGHMFCRKRETAKVSYLTCSTEAIYNGLHAASTGISRPFDHFLDGH